MKKVIIADLINDKNVVNIYKFGSYVYGTNNAHSDEDYIIVCEEWFDTNNNDIHCYTIQQFQNLLDNCDVQMLECYFLSKEFIILEKHQFTFNLNKEKLRISISTITSNSWVKGKKKLTVMGDYDLNIAIKSVFHSLRILDLGIQLCVDEKITNYGAMNYVLYDLIKLSEQYKYIDLWDKINEKYKKVFNALSTSFKAKCPKNIIESNKKSQIISILKEFGIENEDLANQLLMI